MDNYIRQTKTYYSSSEQESLISFNKSSKIMINFNKAFIYDSKLKNLPGLIFMTFVILIGFILYDVFVESRLQRLTIPDFSSLFSYLTRQTYLSKMLVIFNQLLLFAFTISLSSSITTRQQYKQALKTKQLLDLNFKKNAMVIMCIISTFCLIGISIGLFQDRSKNILATVEPLINSESKPPSINQYLIQIFIMSMYLYNVFFVAIITSNFLEVKTVSTNIFTVLVISLTLQMALFYTSEGAHFILETSINTKSIVKMIQYKQLLMFTIDILFILMILTSQIILLISGSYFSAVHQELTEELEELYNESIESIKEGSIRSTL
jgi:hypothetical protein